MAETTFCLLMISHSLALSIWWGSKGQAANALKLLMHRRKVKGSLYSEDKGKYIHDSLTCVWNTVQVTATSSPPATFSVTIPLQKPYCCPQKERSYLNQFRKWTSLPVSLIRQHIKGKKLKFLIPFLKIKPFPKVYGFCLYFI